MKSFRRSQNPSPAIKYPNRAAKRNALRHQAFWAALDAAKGASGTPRRVS